MSLFPGKSDAGHSSNLPLPMLVKHQLGRRRRESIAAIKDADADADTVPAPRQGMIPETGLLTESLQNY